MKFDNDHLKTLKNSLDLCCKVFPDKVKTPSDFIVRCMYPQLWSDSNMEFLRPQKTNNDVVENYPTVAYTCALEDIETGSFVIFFGGRLAYVVKKPNENLYEDLYGRCLICAKKYTNQYECEFTI